MAIEPGRAVYGASGVVTERGFRACAPAARSPLQPDRIEPRAQAPAPHFHTVDLAALEGHGAHTIARHVARSLESLRLRLQNEHIDAASSFPDLRTAQDAVDTAIGQNQSKIGVWLRTGAHTLALSVRFSQPVGRVLRRGADAPETTPAARIVLARRATMPQGFTVLTAYPTVQQ